MKTAYQLVSISPVLLPGPLVVPGERYTYRISRITAFLHTSGSGPIVPLLSVYDKAGGLLARFAGGGINATAQDVVVHFAPGILPNMDQLGVPGIGAGAALTVNFGIIVNIPIPADVLIEEGMRWELLFDGATGGSGVDELQSVSLVRYVDPS